MLVYGARAKTVEIVQTDGVWIGIIDDVEGLNKDSAFSMESNDVLLLYTDGIPEAMDDNNHMFSDKRLIETFHKFANAGSCDTEDIKKWNSWRTCGV